MVGARRLRKGIALLKHLSIIEMGSIIGPWVNKTKRREAFLSIPEIAGLHAKIVALHGDLLAAQPADATPSPKLRAIIEQAEAVDQVHDALARAVHAGVTAERAYALAEKPPAAERARQAEAVLARLFPDGLAIVNASLLAEAGNAARVAALLEQEPAVAGVLAAIPVHGAGDLRVVTQRWIATGKKLAKLDDERDELEAERATASPGSEAMNRLRARWIRLVSQVLSLLELSDADPLAIARVRLPVLKASARASKRYGAPVPAEEAEALADEDDDDVATPVAANG